MSSRDVRVRHAAISEAPLQVTEVLRHLEHSAAGGLALFVGVVRDHDGGKGVAGLSYSAHPDAATELARVAESSLTDGVLGIAAVHRVGELVVGDVAVITAVAAAHRGPALAVNAQLIERIKREVPVWKHQRFQDGTDEWVGL